jgi:DNA repair protein SbcC/Rad50
MIPIHLRITGFLSYQDPVELDFGAFQLACISGSNGAGKSSLLDAMTWALFGQARRKDDSILNGHSDTAEVCLDFSYEENIYRILRSKTRNKSTLLNFFVQDQVGKWKVLTEHTVKETEERIVNTLRLDYDTFINASFFLQGKADLFAQQRPNERKRILSNILGLEIWDDYKERTTIRRKQFEENQAVLGTRIEEIDDELTQEGERREKLKKIEGELAKASSRRKEKEILLEDLRLQAAALEEQKRWLERLAAQLDGVRGRREKLVLDFQARNEDLKVYQHQIKQAQEIETAYQNWQNLRQSLEHWDGVAANFRQYEAQRNSPLMKIETERARLKQEWEMLSAKNQEVISLKNQTPLLEEQLKDVRVVLSDHEIRLNEKDRLSGELRIMQDQNVEMTVENKRLKVEMDELKLRIDRLKETIGAACPVCGQPLSAKDRQDMIASLESQGKDKGGLYRKNQELIRQYGEELARKQTQINSLQKVEGEMRARQRQLDQLEDQKLKIAQAIEEWQANGFQRLEILGEKLAKENYAHEARIELAQVDETLKAIGYDSAEHDAIRRSELEARSSEEALRRLENARAALEPLQREINGMQTQLENEAHEITVQEDAVRSLESQYTAASLRLPDLDLNEREAFALSEEENRLRMQMGGAIQTVEVLKTLKIRKKELVAERSELAGQISRHKVLERAFSKDGIPALLIEQALPELEEEANQILDRLSEDGMSVRFETQRDYKDKKREDRKETLDIIISDSAGTREYELFSGGEAFRINFAIRLALSRVLSQRAGARLRTLVIDEGFGSQDSEGRQRLVEAINLVQTEFDKILVITHLEELKDHFPARIEVEKGLRGSQVKVVL